MKATVFRHVVGNQSCNLGSEGSLLIWAPTDVQGPLISLIEQPDSFGRFLLFTPQEEDEEFITQGFEGSWYKDWF